ncbi:hypothetical protein [Streptomyces sp. NPDC047043]|uniref:hypothetical protein n=1 Tax=Streptomyces sp. NPDC047043 TaxID=3154497 RepID=UPI0033D0DD0A
MAELLADLLSCAPGVPGAQAAERTLRRYPFSAGTAAALAAALVVLVLCGRLSTAAHWAEGLAVAAEERDLTVWHAVFTSLAAEIALRRGALEQAERFGRSALGILPAEGWGVLIGLPIATLLQARTELGRLNQAQELLNLPVPTSCRTPPPDCPTSEPVAVTTWPVASRSPPWPTSSPSATS